MSPLAPLGVFAFPGISGGDFESIATVTVGAGGASVASFPSIPSTFKHLQIRFVARSTNSDNMDNLFINLNSDSSSNYSFHYLLGDGSSVGSGAGASQTKVVTGRITSGTAASNAFGAGIIDIADYASTNKNKTLKNLTGVDLNGAGNIWLWSAGWFNTSAISSITIAAASGTNFAQHTQFALYGIKG